MRERITQPTLYPLVQTSENLNRQWFIKFWDSSDKKRKLNIPDFDSIEARQCYAENLIKKILNNDLKKNTKHKIKMKHIALLYNYVESLKPNLEKSTYQCYVSHVNSLNEYMTTQGIPSLPQLDVGTYILHLSKSIGNAYINDRISSLRNWCEKLKKLKKIRHNPFIGAQKLKETKTNKKRHFTPQQHEVVKKVVEKEKPFLEYPQKVLYYTCLRPKELRLLRIEHILFETGQILIPADIIKTDMERYITLPKQLIALFLEKNLHKLPKHWYIVGYKCQPSERPLGKNYLQRHFRPLLQELGFNTDNYSTYSLKNTANVRIIKTNGMTSKHVQLHNRHTSLRTTEIYLEGFGLDEMPELREQYPEY